MAESSQLCQSDTAMMYLIPEKYYDDVVVEFSPDFEHDSAVFSGSVK
jgi:hypothetical protein